MNSGNESGFDIFPMVSSSSTSTTSSLGKASRTYDVTFSDGLMRAVLTLHHDFTPLVESGVFNLLKIYGTYYANYHCGAFVPSLCSCSNQLGFVKNVIYVTIILERVEWFMIFITQIFAKSMRQSSRILFSAIGRAFIYHIL
jgi:hypothetical protein